MNTSTRRRIGGAESSTFRIGSAETDLVSLVESSGVGDTLAIDERAVCRVEIPDFKATVVEGYDRVSTGDGLISDDKIICFVTTDRYPLL